MSEVKSGKKEDNGPWYYLRDTRGYKSVTVTMLLVSFWITTLSYVISSLESIGSVTFRQFDVAANSVYFGMICALYFGRKFTEAKTATQK